MNTEILKSHNKNPFAIFAASPVGVTFENQEEGEKIILLLRAHLITLVPSVVTIIILALVPFFIAPVFSLLRIDSSSLAPRQVFLITVFWYLLVFGFAFYRFIFWYFNVYLLTNERIIDFDFLGILHKKISYCKLGQIEDVTPKIVGFAGTFFNFGDVFIQTAAERPEFEFGRVAMPDVVAEAIFEQVRKEEAEAPGEIA